MFRHWFWIVIVNTGKFARYAMVHIIGSLFIEISERIFHNEIRYTVVNTDEDSVFEYKKLPLFQKTVRDLIQRLYDRPISNGIAGVSKKDVIEICIENLKKD